MQEADRGGAPSAIPAKRYHSIGETSKLLGVAPHVLRHWEREFPQLKQVQRRGNRRYYQQKDILLLRKIQSLLGDQGYTIKGARQRLADNPVSGGEAPSKALLSQLVGDLEGLLRDLKA